MLNDLEDKINTQIQDNAQRLNIQLKKKNLQV